MVINNIVQLEKRIREKRLVRIICKPWKDWQLKQLHRKYLKSGYGEELRKFKGLYEGKRCFIIGNGPSLTVRDLEQLKNEYTFAANRIYNMFTQTDWRPWSYVVIDPDFIRVEQENIIKVPCVNRFVSYKKKIRETEQHTYKVLEIAKEFPINIGNDTTAYIAEDISDGISRGWTVTFSSIQLAIYMGFQEIYLIGVDFNYSTYLDAEGNIRHQDGVKDYFDGKKYEASCMNYAPTLYAYKTARTYCDAHGITIKNATRGGKLEVFERVDFDSLFIQ